MISFKSSGKPRHDLAPSGMAVTSRWSSYLRGKSPSYLCFLVAVGSVTLSCYPVIFFGKSFVSPNVAGTYMLYPTVPTLPHYRDTHIENTHGSDNAAMLWQNLPYSFIENRAFFRDKQLPLWDRWNSAGTPLLGQGISMLGDPLELFVIICRDAAWAWDIKFIVAKLLFCWGIGLCVFFATKNLPSALFLTFSSAFIGFFYDRFIHPAYFSLCYAPWILLAWLAFTAAASKRNEAAWAALLVVASWFELNSGTVKEAYMLLLSLHASGLLLFLVSHCVSKLRKAAHLLCAGTSFVLLSAPVWSTFLWSLHQSLTAYDQPHAWQLQPALLLGFFDDIFYRVLDANGNIFCPSANFLILLGVILSFTGIKAFSRNRTWCVISLSALVACALAFGVVPAAIITKIPFLANIVHVDTVFSSILIFYCIILTGFGLANYFKNWDASSKSIPVVGGLLVLLSLFLGFTQAELSPPLTFKPFGYPGAHNLFIQFYIASLFLCAIALPWLMRWRYLQRRRVLAANVLTTICLLALHWRFGLHLNTGLASIDDLVINPQVRVNLTPPSPTIDFLRQQPAAFRTVGFVDTLFPGYNAIAGLESIYGVDPLINPYYRELLLAAGVKLAWTWRWVIEKTNFNSVLPFYSLLNVRYFLDPLNDRIQPPAPLERVARLDLDIYENRNCWPRAFFTNKLTSYQSLGQFVALTRSGDGRAFAAVQAKDIPSIPFPIVNESSIEQRDIVPAHDYFLKTNDTSFTLDAPGPGVVVLTEAFLARDFIARVNGVRVSYFRVNHAFRGLKLPAAGVYRVSFSYWPRYFTRALLLSGVGLVLFVIWLLLSIKAGGARATAPARM